MAKVVMAFGAFDGIHEGHRYYLGEAKKLGDKLVVAIARDETIWKFSRKYKFNEEERKKLVEETEIPDKVILGSKDTSLEMVLKVKPDIIAITEHTPVNMAVLQAELSEKGLRTKVVEIPFVDKEC